MMSSLEESGPHTKPSQLSSLHAIGSSAIESDSESASSSSYSSDSESSSSSSGANPFGVSASPINIPLKAIHGFLKETTCYDMLPESYRITVFDTDLPIMKSIQAMATTGNLCAPLYNSHHQRFDGLFKLSEVTHLLSYLYDKLVVKNEETGQETVDYNQLAVEIESMQLKNLRTIEQAIDVPSLTTIDLHPSESLYQAALQLIDSDARRLPLIDRDEDDKETFVGIIAQYRVLMFIAVNCTTECDLLQESIGKLGIGSYIRGYECDADMYGSRSRPSTAASSHRRSSRRQSSTGPDFQFEPISPSTQVIPITTSLSGPLPTHSSTNPPPAASTNTISDTSPRSISPPTDLLDPDHDLSMHALQDLNIESSPSKSISRLSGMSAKTSDSLPQMPHKNTAKMALSYNNDVYHPIATAKMSSKVFDVVRLFSERNISAVPIINDDGVVLDLYEIVDVVDLLVFKSYKLLDGTIEEALRQRPQDFGGIPTCTPETPLAELLHYLADHRVHRFVIVEPREVWKQSSDGKTPPLLIRPQGALVGMLSLSDIMHFLIGKVKLKGPEIFGFGLHAIRALGIDEEDNEF